MFGFVRPLRGELKVREWERFQSVYCGLCHTIRSRYGLLQTVMHSYDCTYLALVLCALEEEGASCRRRCILHPLRRRTCASESEGLRRAAAVSVVLSWHKLADTVRDERGLKRFGARALQFLLRRGYRKAARDLPEFDARTRDCLDELDRLERQRVVSLDRPADAFARILRAAVADSGTDSRVLQEMFYHTGRWIYLIDACDDVAEDFASGSYNPVILRWQLAQPSLAPVREEMNHTLLQSLAASYHAYILLRPHRDAGIIENILCQGLPEVTRQVLDGTFTNHGGKNRHGSL
ncbi:MAG TPA: hypothetical protein IAA32_04255 [Candidatus Butyricicoccus stercorigallinarum]|nr:hypothetical protein [Candidatus Butyricicoccus stercorigallinarum]